MLGRKNPLRTYYVDPRKIRCSNADEKNSPLYEYGVYCVGTHIRRKKRIMAGSSGHIFVEDANVDEGVLN